MHNQLLLKREKITNPKHLFGLIRMGKNVKTRKKSEINGRVSQKIKKKRGMHKQHSPISLFLCVCVMLICLEHDLAITEFIARV